MGLFSRIGTLFRSNINELINKAEDPEKMLNQVLVDMKSQLVEAKKQVAVAIADEKRIKKQLDQETAKAKDWERKAMLAIKAGDDGLARAALARKSTPSYDELFAATEATIALRGSDDRTTAGSDSRPTGDGEGEEESYPTGTGIQAVLNSVVFDILERKAIHQ